MLSVLSESLQKGLEQMTDHRQRPSYRKTPIDEIAIECLPERITEAIRGMEVTIEEVIQMESMKPEMRIVVTDKELKVTIKKRFSVKKTVATFVGVLGMVCAIAKFVIPSLSSLF